MPEITRDDERLYRLDAYGGCDLFKAEASGFFRLEQALDRWWFITPDGRPFVSWGLNHAAPSFMRWPYNRRYWQARWGLENLNDDNPAFQRAFEDKVRREMAGWNMNTLGCHSPTTIYPAWRVPYVHPFHFVEICHWQEPGPEAFRDVFSPAFAAHCDAVAAAEVAPRRADPYVLGYSFSDCPILTRLDAAPRVRVTYGRDRPATPTWPNVLRNLPGDRAGKRAYVDLARELYGGDVAAFNAVYGTVFDAWEALQAAADWCPGVDWSHPQKRRDHDRFLERIVARYYQVATEAVRRHDPNHLILGDKLNGNTGVPDEIVRIVSREVDCIFYQYYAPYSEQAPLLDRWSALVDKPLFNGDSSYSVPYDQSAHPNGPHARDQRERAVYTTDFGTRAFSRPNFVGWSWCGWMDNWNGYGSDARHSGLQDPFGNMYVPMQQALADIGGRLYALAMGLVDR